MKTLSIIISLVDFDTDLVTIAHMKTTGSPDGPLLVTAAEVSRYAGVTRATVSNWRRRHADFPAMTAGTEARPLFDLGEVRTWLATHGYESARSPVSELRTLLQTQVRPEDIAPALAGIRVDSGRLKVSESPHRLSPELSAAIREVATANGARMVLEIAAERALQGSLESGQYWTPPILARLMADLLAIPGTDYPRSVLDPACGSGGLLIEAARLGAAELYGQDLIASQTELARLTVGLDTDIDPEVRTGDSLRDDGFPVLQADAVLCNPPFGQRDWGIDQLAFDSRWEYGQPPRIESELAWIQHGLAHLRPGGTAVFLLPPAVAARNSGRRIRAALLRAGTVRSVIALPTGSVPSMSIGLHLWVLRRPEVGAVVPDRVLFVDAPPERESLDVFAGRVVKLWHAFGTTPESFEPVPDAAESVPVVTLLDDLVDLTPARHTHVPLDPHMLSARVDELAANLSAQTDEIRTHAGIFRGWPVTHSAAWRTATLSSLTQGGALQILRTVSRPEETPDTVRDSSLLVLTSKDVISDTRASTPAGELAISSKLIVIAVGDVVLPAVRAQRSLLTLRVADEADAGVAAGPGVVVLRPDRERLDSWFLAGFAAYADNAGHTTGSTARTETNRIRVPILPLHKQQQYGAAFRRINAMRCAARQTSESADKLIGLMSASLTAGAMTPPDDDEGSIRWND
ncbi:N-6 DNA methylase [Nocardia sp. BMG51109]|uniref:N-6 DNA methylase n=1 Tax=Nocardia sp. BMG51109 TaxID=1056816 RepID=UPI0004B1C8C1|nr:N-6 DNA methylase [Nocardia sp. BMG51109]